ncbi:MAG: SDR family oxidoreductase [Muricauda sp.]|nr:SDR family oxidoreductase [Allomuricauda sp.]MBO6532270.1 SDR family oxidoreductase [Allomuricauda sp.]MBO6588404.1 SDR family oxidoreductase [Allomuricauda sp.]MBO6618456.1 SDR family oxidoreductase [Allomuricauda sp.]MBO6643942.1 SDR family oxidoreductase [Allomuricauda sp.]MBO6746826.1 SDR family oxidoreductase [Allomuricauda sp.]
MNISLQGKKALVGGSSKGIGAAIAKQMAASGASVTLMARSEGRMQELIEEMDSSQGQQHQFLSVDFTDFEAYKTKITAYFENNTVDILVNNTQGPEGGGALEKKVDDYQNAFDLLFKSVVYTTELALKHMQEQHWGRIINIASISVKEPLNYLALSNTIRAAVVTWAKSLAYDVAKDGITVNSTLTGYFDTDRIAQLNSKKAEKMGVSPDEVRSNMEEQVPVKRIGDPKEYGYLVAFLASEQAAFITGTNIPIDGGLLKSL